MTGLSPEGLSVERTGGLIMVPASGQTVLPVEVLTVRVNGSDWNKTRVEPPYVRHMPVKNGSSKSSLSIKALRRVNDFIRIEEGDHAAQH